MEGNDLKTRLVAYARERFDYGQNKFEEYCGISRGTINAIPDGGGISTKSLTKIALACPDLDLRWLLTGERTQLEEMPVRTEKVADSAPEVVNPSADEVAFYRRLIESQQRTIELLAGKGGSVSQSVQK